ncbi:sigma54 specific transcriptional regulator, Fis family [Pseudonocardia dioxanivorans CB1190]|uniref:Sigma54 specific transcriptional regulator, Fis family n=1 Tax=Pseudonocardia dioxanivorans (strain ATCC 55486 / DSM 44775 / JCM 13855 / CB1190) TaxID=675635 RepID=F4CK05_PSEUX|nr:helix-turn-helix domain-containing protein [Pseudonocardia dioxanivorans]AEA28111.1 sigma54 specific transcriptional regulator, Fis family [Pseudonocardia dioxanivorans CB1190]
MDGSASLSEREQIARPVAVGAGSVVSDRLAASWRRSTEFGASLDEVAPAFSGSVDEESLFFRSGLDVIGGLQETLANEPISLMLTDPDGVVLTRLCRERSLLSALDSVYLAPGFDYGEREAGTTGLGLALADRAPALVRADQHFCAELWGYTCAAAPVLDPVTGELAGTVNLTTWAQQSDNMLLALAQSAASSTTALMLARHRGRSPRPAPHGQVFRVFLRPPGTSAVALSAGWRTAVAEVEAALSAGRVVAVVGEDGVGRRSLLTEALARTHPRGRVLVARPPAPRDTAAWLDLWGPELGKEATSIVVSEVDELSSLAATKLSGHLHGVASAPDAGPDGPRPAVAFTARDASTVPEPLRPLVDTYVELPPLRRRRADILPLASAFAARRRHREVGFTAAARRSLTAYDWPGNVEQLRSVVDIAAARSDMVDVEHLPAELVSGAPRRVLSRIETVERDEILRCLAEPGITMTEAAVRLGISRATLYRRIEVYGLRDTREGSAR